MKKNEFFKEESANIYYAINTERNYFIHVLLLKEETIIAVVKCKNRTNLKYLHCLENCISIPSEEFIGALRKADEIQNNLPFDLIKTPETSQKISNKQ